MFTSAHELARPDGISRRSIVARVVMFQNPLQRQTGRLVAGALNLPVAIGRSGMRVDKREGDGATPIGSFSLLKLWRRPLRQFGPARLPQRFIRPEDLWCDAAGHRLYNRPARAPLQASHEEMWRSDSLYDVVIEIGWNIRPRVQGRGGISADSWLHCTGPARYAQAPAFARTRNPPRSEALICPNSRINHVPFLPAVRSRRNPLRDG
jgi:L,D-peptidoglycan transpeptidase YkuD (ErfK/YbiS/YcfS/YnhG family)